MSDFQLPLVSLINNRPSTTSLTIAEYFGKEHKNVLADIRSLIAQCPNNFTELNFQPSEYSDPTGRKLPMFHVFFDGFIILVMGYTGKRALQMKLAYIEAFNAMKARLEEKISFNPKSPINESQIATLRAILKSRLESHAKNHGHLMSLYGMAWKQFNSHFDLGKFTDLRQEKMIEAVEFLISYQVLDEKAPQVEKTAIKPKELPAASLSIEEIVSQELPLVRQLHCDMSRAILNMRDKIMESLYRSKRKGNLAALERSFLDCLNNSLGEINVTLWSNLNAFEKILSAEIYAQKILASQS